MNTTIKNTIVTILSIFSLANCTIKNDQDRNKSLTPMEVKLPATTKHLETWKKNLNSMYTVFVARDIEASKNFYTKWFGYSIVFESSWFLLLASPGDQSQIAFISEEHPSSPPTPKVFSGNGAFLTLDVKDAETLFDVMRTAGIPTVYELTDEPWGQRRFAVTDPNGMWIDIVQQIQPEAGWWEKNQ
jgi:catechol 2,3-dioxygenase-like lactoylglutathione lyase family enzyme